MNKINTLVISTLFISFLGMTSIASANDPVTTKEKGREAIILTEKERHAVLTEMRGFLESVQTIVVGLSKNDWESTSKAARKSGMVEQTGMPKSLGKKLPKAFKILGQKTHKAFDQLALDIKDMEDKQQALEQLGSLMKNCVSCHALFKFETEK
ncbi:MAG: cytochrome c [Cocleimonas sp.]|nr:cytochrome c [Cocleimonas sp.]